MKTQNNITYIRYVCTTSILYELWWFKVILWRQNKQALQMNNANLIYILRSLIFYIIYAASLSYLKKVSDATPGVF